MKKADIRINRRTASKVTGGLKNTLNSQYSPPPVAKINAQQIRHPNPNDFAISSPMSPITSVIN
jgi:hypothetical protein